MLFAYYFNTVLCLFFVSFPQIMVAIENIEVPLTNRTLDDVSKQPWLVYCRFQKNEHACGRIIGSRRYYYDVRLETCVRFQYANCRHTYNMFSSLPACRSQCQDLGLRHAPVNVTENVYCRFQPEFGACNSYHPMFYFDISEMACKGFSFSGCGGNHNRFETINDCLKVCHPAVKQDANSK
ncbi:kunitz-type serine protease inhibitor A [Helicoverpa armigera]|uniref:kunitz-type serine protease inhibitor A n=1 Tax=Helicoverpa armigera TaxID=29058 RepID=UPI003083104F